MFIFLDTETTGLEEKDKLCQLAYKIEDTIVNELFNPGININYEAMAVNHITDEMVANKPVFKNSEHWQILKDVLESGEHILVAHNAEFDVKILHKEDIYPKNIICTKKLSQFLDSGGVFTQHSLQYLRYRLNINIDAIAHDAEGDVLVLEKVFTRIFEKVEKLYIDKAVDKMLEISANPVMIARMPFGKHKGKLMKDIPNDYLRWLSGTELDSDLKFTVNSLL